MKKIDKLVDEQKNQKKYSLYFDLLAQEGYSYNCALWAKKILREMNIRLLDNNSIEKIADVLAQNDKIKYLWFHFKYVLQSLSLSFHSPNGYVKINSSDKLMELKKRFIEYKDHIE